MLGSSVRRSPDIVARPVAEWPPLSSEANTDQLPSGLIVSVPPFNGCPFWTASYVPAIEAKD